MCGCHERWVSRMMPRYLAFCFRGMSIPFICIVTFFRDFWGGWKRSKLDLDIFKDSLLALNQLAT